MWRCLLGRCHPDAGGDYDLFIWAGALREPLAEAFEENSNAIAAYHRPVEGQ